MRCVAPELGHGPCEREALAGRAVCYEHLLANMQKLEMTERERIRYAIEAIAAAEAAIRDLHSIVREASRQRKDEDESSKSR